MNEEEPELWLVSVSAKGQFAIPVGIRRKLDIKKGDKLLISLHGKRVMIEKSGEISEALQEDFKYLLAFSERTFRKLWDNDKDEVWNEV